MAQILDLGKFRYDFRGAWSVSTEYERNDVVRYGGNVYVYTLGTASTANLPTNTAFWAIMVSGTEYRGSWDSAEEYELGQIVSYGGKVYIAVQSVNLNQNPVTATSYWSVFVDGIQYEGTYSGSTAYQKGDVVKYGGAVYIAKSNTTGTLPSVTGTWDILIYGVEYKGAYNSGTTYKPNDIVTFGGTAYIALLAATGVTPVSGATWAIFVEGFQFEGEYSNSTAYQKGDVVNYGGIVYVAIANTTANAPTDTVYWTKLIEGIAWKSTYNSLTAYNKNDIVAYSGSSWIAKLNTTGNAPAVGAYWDLLAAGTFPSFTGNTGKFLSNDGTQATWVSDITVSELQVTDKIYSGPSAKTVALANGTNVKNLSFRAITSNVATMTTTTAHGFSPFQYVTIAGAAAPFNGTWEITAVPTSTTFRFAVTNANISSVASAGTASAVTGFTNLMGFTTIDADDDYAQFAIQNTGNGANSSTDFQAYANNGTDFSGYIDMGITSSNFNDPEFTITGPNDGYIFMTAPVGSTGAGNLVLATGAQGSANKIIFAAGGLDSNSTQMEITPDVNVHIEIPTPSTTPTTGALTVVGGVGISGDMNIQGNVSIVGAITFGGSGTSTVIDTVSSTDPVTRTGANNPDDLYDLGIIGEYAVAVSNVVRTVSNKALTSNVATLTTTAAHTYAVGDVVVVSGVDATFNGTVIVTGVTSTTFSYAKTATNVVSVASAGTATKTRERRWRGMVRDATDGIVKLFAGSTVVPGNTVDFSNAGITYSALQTGPITASTLTIGASGSITATASGVTSAIQNLTLSGSANVFDSTTISMTGATMTGNYTVSGNPTFSGAPIFSGTPAFTGGIRIQEMIEDVVDIALSSNVASIDYAVGNIFFTTSTPSAAMTWQITNAPTTDGRVFTINVMVTQGATGYIPTTFTINGNAVTMKWAAGVAPTPTSSNGKIDIFSLTILRRASAYTLLGSANLNF
jgi:hypothetical protein